MNTFSQRSDMNSLIRPHLCLFGIIIVFIHFLPAQQANNTHQLLWEISGNGLAESSYLYGTMHVKDKRAFNFSDSVLAKLYHCKIFAMEVHPDSALASVFRRMEKGKAPLLKDVMEEEEFEQLNEQFREQTGRDLENVKTNRLFQLKQLLSREEPASDERPVILDAYLFHLAQSWGKKLAGLENPEDLSGLFDETSIDEIKELVENELLRDFRKGAIDELIDIYSKGDLESVESFSAMQSARNPEFMNQLLTIRNKQMVDRMEPLMREGQTFTAVGVAHLPGKGGIIDLLEQKGFQVQPVKATFTGLAKIYEDMPRESSLWKRFVGNEKAAYSIDFPGSPISQDINNGLGRIHVVQNVGTGDAYTILVIQGGDNATDRNLDVLYQRMFEGWKSSGRFGADLKEEQLLDIEKGGVKGKEVILTASQPQNMQLKLQIFVRNGYMYMPFVVLPEGLKEENKQIDHFFESLTFAPLPQQKWETFMSLKGAFEVLMADGVDEVVEFSMEEGTRVQTLLIQAIDNQSGAEYLAGFNAFGTDLIFKTDSSTLKYMIDASMSEFPNMEILSDTSFYMQELPAREVIIGHPEGENLLKIRYRFILRGGRMYYLVNSYIKEDPLQQTFFDSFRLLPFLQSNWARFTDSLGRFSLLLPDYAVDEDEVDYGLESNFSYYTLPHDYYEQSGRQVLSYDSLTSTTYYFYEIMLSDFWEVPNADSVFQKVIDEYRESVVDELVFDEEGPAEIVHEETIEIAGFPGKEIWLKSPSSHLTFRCRMALKGKYLYYGFAFLPEDLLTDSHTQTYFESFQLSAEPTEEQIFSNKKMTIIEGLSSSDSVRQLFAKSAFKDYEFPLSDTTLLLNLLDKNYGDEEWGSNSTLFLVFSKLKDLQTKSWLHKITDSYARLDSATDLSLELLNMLLEADADQAINRMKKLFFSRPLPYEYYPVSTFYRQLSEFPEAAKSLYPEIFSLLENDEWFSPTLSHILAMSDSGLVKLDSFPSFTQTILDIATSELDTLTVAGVQHYRNNWRHELIVQALGKAEFRSEVITLLKKYLALDILEFKLFASLSLLQQGEKVSKATLKEIASDPYQRYALFDGLSKLNERKYFPKKYAKQQLIAEGELFYYISEYDDVPTKITFIEKRNVEIAGKKGVVYLFKVSWGEPDTDYHYEQLSISSVYANDPKNLVPIFPDSWMWSYDSFSQEEMENQYRELMERMQESLSEEK